MRPCIDPEKFDRMKQVLGTPLVHELLGCQWGRALHDYEDTAVCEEPAAQIVALHPDGGDDMVHVKLCERHVERINEISTPHEGSTHAAEG